MPQIYLSQAEFEALEFFRGVAQAASESATDEVYCRNYAAACKAYSSVENKFYKSKAKQKLECGCQSRRQTDTGTG